jgi:hypothetical protein
MSRCGEQLRMVIYDSGEARKRAHIKKWYKRMLFFYWTGNDDSTICTFGKWKVTGINEMIITFYIIGNLFQKINLRECLHRWRGHALFLFPDQMVLEKLLRYVWYYRTLRITAIMWFIYTYLAVVGVSLIVLSTHTSFSHEQLRTVKTKIVHLHLKNEQYYFW